MKAIITRKLPLATDICLFELSSADSEPLPPFSAGAHIDVHVDGFTRQYSLCNSPAERGVYQIGVLRDPASRGGSIAMHAYAAGATLEISEPRNHFPLDAHAKHTILLAGGIGITPILCMAMELLDTGRSFELHYCTRELARAAFLDRLAQAGLKEHSHLYFDSDAAEQRIDLQAVLAQPDQDTHVYVCGPAGFIDAVLGTATNAGWPAANLHREYFGARQEVEGSSDSNVAFQVSLASSGKLVEVPAGTTVVEALRTCGIEVPVSCEQGVCGTCLTRVLAGEPDHRDVYLTDEERAANDQFLPCCSRSKTPVLVIDL
ncbi:oxidoreductase [Paraburkholderia sp. Ac-20336]|uniref:PDR/VanB family oxidoreductase n=1 Tax=Paraburkholderia sp. Ac-20336 TaxID=2703886 RepID=UPI00197DB9D4|nr:PDR/VanB family oxidoreductase [Paraburkholderia sp. Ac-20336]MBN3801469.1 oxidoreductase [Paraburkholderia sp. Ac-20336]